MNPHDPWENTQRRYAAYCVAHGAVTPDEMVATDRERYPGGVMSGYIRWINQRWQEWDEATGHNKLVHDKEDHKEFDEWLAEHSLIRPALIWPRNQPEPTRRFFWGKVPELTDDHAIWTDDPRGGDPLIVCTIARIHRPELLDILFNGGQSPRTMRNEK